MCRGLCAGVRGWSLTWPCWLGTACRVAAPPRGWGRPGSLPGPSSLESVWPVHPQGAPGFACGQQAQDGSSGTSQLPWWLGCPPGPGTVADPAALVSGQGDQGCLSPLGRHWAESWCWEAEVIFRCSAVERAPWNCQLSQALSLTHTGAGCQQAPLLVQGLPGAGILAGAF